MEAQNHLFPIFLKLENLHVLLVGGGKIGTEKLTALLANCPLVTVTVVADWLAPEMQVLLQANPHVEVMQRKFEINDLSQKDVIIIAISDHEVSKAIAHSAKERRLLTNVADTPHLCDFYLGSIVQKGALKIGISTNGTSPTLAKRIKEFLNEIIPESINISLHNLEAIRKKNQWSFQEKVDKLNHITSVISNNASQ